MFEQYTNRALVTQTWEWTGIDWPGLIWFAGTGAQRFTWPVDTMIDQAGWFMLKPAPLSAVNSVKVWSSGTQQTLSASQYLVDTKGMPGRMRFTGSLPSPATTAAASARRPPTESRPGRSPAQESSPSAPRPVHSPRSNSDDRAPRCSACAWLRANTRSARYPATTCSARDSPR